MPRLSDATRAIHRPVGRRGDGRVPLGGGDGGLSDARRPFLVGRGGRQVGSWCGSLDAGCAGHDGVYLQRVVPPLRFAARVVRPGGGRRGGVRGRVGGRQEHAFRAVAAKRGGGNALERRPADAPRGGRRHALPLRFALERQDALLSQRAGAAYGFLPDGAGCGEPRGADDARRGFRATAFVVCAGERRRADLCADNGNVCRVGRQCPDVSVAVAPRSGCRTLDLSVQHGEDSSITNNERMEDKIMKEKRKYETPKVEVLEVELRDAIANMSCSKSVAIQIGGDVKKNQQKIENIGNVAGGTGSISWDEGM